MRDKVAVICSEVNDLDEREDCDDLFHHHPILKEYSNVFPSEIPGMPLKSDINFRIELVPGAEPGLLRS